MLECHTFFFSDLIFSLNQLLVEYNEFESFEQNKLVDLSI